MKYDTSELRDFIARFESRGDYNIVWGGIRSSDHPPRPLVDMTIGQVLNWQDSIDHKYMSEAAGKYQIMEDTLRGLYAAAGLDLGDLFNEANQDRLAYQLLERRGLTDFMEGRIGRMKFANNLAREWASLPVVSGPKKGRSYYAGDGLNKAHATVGGVLNAIDSIVAAPPSWKNPVFAAEPPAASTPGVVEILINFLRSIFK